MKKVFIVLCMFCSLTSIADDKTDDKNNKRMEQFTNRLDEGDKIAATKPRASTGKEGDVLFRDTIVTMLKVKSFPDVSGYYSECYRKVVNKYGLWKGVGKPLSKEDLRHVYSYVKLLRPAWLPSTAPFTHMQVMNSFGDLDNESYAPFLANPFGNDEGISDSWKNRLKSICQFEKISRGGVLVQENMYDKEGALILQYIPTSVGKNQIVGYYVDAYGVLAHLRNDEECTNVFITLDDNGYECKLVYTDSEGRYKRNDDNAFFQLWTRDAQGNNIRVMSADAVEKPILDNYGNCGWLYKYDANGNMIESTCIDQYGNPMRMPTVRGGNNQIRTRYVNDKWGNTLTWAYYDADWNPDTISGGIHRYISTYTLHGNRTSLRAEGLDGRLVNYNGDIAFWSRKLDDQGHILFSKQLNADSLLSRSDECLSRSKYQNGRLVWSEKYTSTNGVDTVLQYKFVANQFCDTTIDISNEYIKLVHYDDKHRIVSDEYYNLDGTPRQYSAYHKHTIDYNDSPGYSVRVDKYLGEDGTFINLESTWRSYNVDSIHNDYIHRKSMDIERDGDKLLRTIEVDTVAREKIVTRYKEGRIIDKYGQLMSEDFSRSEALLYYDSLGYQGRTFKADALYYRAGKMVNAQGNNTSWRGINEFGEPSYVLTGDWSSASIYCVNVLGDKYYYDEYGDTIPSSTEGLVNFKNKLRKAFCIELTGTKAYDIGLRTGDIIVRFGDWHYPVPSTAGGYNENILCLETVRKATTEKVIVVMRHDPQTRTSKLLQFTLPKGTPAQLGFLYHMIYLTNKEYKRYTATVIKLRSSVNLNAVTTSQAEKERVDFIKPCKVGTTKAKKVFSGGFQENAIVLAWEPYVDGKSYFYKLQDSYIDIDNAFKQPYDSIALYYTVDGHNVNRYVFYDDKFRNYVNRAYTSIPDASDFYTIADSLQNVFNASHPEEPVILTPQQAEARLLAFPTGVRKIDSDVKKFSGKGIDKYGNVTNAYYINIDYGSMTRDDMFVARNILQNIDFSDYLYTTNDDYYAYLHRVNNHFDEACWVGGHGVQFLKGELSMMGKKLITLEVVDGGQMSQQGLSGIYVVLQYDTWHFGMTYSKLVDVMENSPSPIRNAKLARVIGEGEEMKLGKTLHCKFQKVKVGAYRSWTLLPEHIYNEVLRRTKR